MLFYYWFILSINSIVKSKRKRKKIFLLSAIIYANTSYSLHLHIHKEILGRFLLSLSYRLILIDLLIKKTFGLVFVSFQDDFCLGRDEIDACFMKTTHPLTYFPKQIKREQKKSKRDSSTSTIHHLSSFIPMTK